MSRWVNGSLEDLLMVSISPRASSTSRMTSALRAEQELTSWDGEEPPATLRSDGSACPDPPFKVGAFFDELANHGLELGLRLLVVDSIAAMLPMDAGNATFFAHAAAVTSLRESLDTVCTRAGDPRVVRVMAPEAPLGAYVKGLYLRASAVVRALEMLGFQSLDDAGGGEAFGRAVAEAAAFHFPDLRDSARRDLAQLRLDLGQTSIVCGLRDAVEKLFVASALLDEIRTS